MNAPVLQQPILRDGHATLPGLFRHRVQEMGERVAMREKEYGIWKPISWNEYGRRARAIGMGLAALGLRRGDVVAILSENNKEWIYTDIGAICAGGVALAFHGSESRLVLVAMFVAGALGGMAWAAIPALLRTRFNTNEILVSLMLVYVASLLLSWLVHGPWRDPEGFNFPQSKQFTDAARYAGFNANRMVWLGMLVSGACAGLAGMGEVAGPIGQLLPSVSPGYGFAAIIVAFVGRLHPVGIFFASLLMSLLYLGGESAQMKLALPSSVTGLFQGTLLLFLLASDVFIHYRLRVTRRAPAAKRAA